MFNFFAIVLASAIFGLAVAAPTKCPTTLSQLDERNVIMNTLATYEAALQIPCIEAVMNTTAYATCLEKQSDLADTKMGLYEELAEAALGKPLLEECNMLRSGSASSALPTATDSLTIAADTPGPASMFPSEPEAANSTNIAELAHAAAPEHLSSKVVAQLYTSGGSFGGRATWFAPGLGACGKYNRGSDYIVALNAAQYSGGSRCGKWVQIRSGGRSVRCKVVDKCPGCGYGSLDLSPAAFKALARLDQGVARISWSWA